MALLEWFARGFRSPTSPETWQPASWAPGLREAGAGAPVAGPAGATAATSQHAAFEAAVVAAGLGAGGLEAEPGTAAVKPRRARVPAAVPFPSTGPHGHRERLRERLLDRGQTALHDYELLEMLLFFAIPKGDTKPLAKALINRFGSFAAVLAAPQQTLLDTSGLGTHSVAALKLVQEAAVRMLRAEVLEQPVLNRWDRLMEYLNAVMAREKIEQFRILFLDSKNRLLADEAQSRGTVNHAPVYPREVVKRALELHATALILVHNHPSGDPSPSKEDLAMTREVKEAAAVLGIALHDHVIVGNGRWLSFRSEGLL